LRPRAAGENAAVEPIIRLRAIGDAGTRDAAWSRDAVA
jgi:hypothetical protein